jgi:ribosomal protein S18 acetylase RimI-like enzyme
MWFSGGQKQIKLYNRTSFMEQLEVTVRKAFAHDAEIIADLSRKTFAESFGDRNTKEDMDVFMNEQFTKAELMREVQMPSNIFLMAYLGEKLVGYVKLRNGERPPAIRQFNCLEIARLYVVGEMTGKGVGSVLMRHCIALATDMNMEAIWLSVWEKNHRAFAFYKRWGFEKIGHQLFLLGKDLQNDWVMRKML